ncbi:MAG TPA: hypothetical protein VI322_04715 [Candidatus Saccharimonadia bacterium]
MPNLTSNPPPAEAPAPPVNPELPRLEPPPPVAYEGYRKLSLVQRLLPGVHDVGRAMRWVRRLIVLAILAFLVNAYGLAFVTDFFHAVQAWVNQLLPGV